MPKRFMGSVPRPAAKRFRVSVPDADESVLAWIGAQSNLSESVRALIREAIERNGYRDATCYPVVQQPRRGRPPKNVDETAYETVHAVAPEPVDEPRDEAPAPVTAPTLVHDEHSDEAPALSNIEDVFGSLR